MRCSEGLLFLFHSLLSARLLRSKCAKLLALDLRELIDFCVPEELLELGVFGADCSSLCCWIAWSSASSLLKRGQRI